MAIRKTKDKSGETDPNIVRVFDLLRNGTRVFLGRIWEQENGMWQWESYWGGNRGVEPNQEAATIMIEKVARDKFGTTQ